MASARQDIVNRMGKLLKEIEQIYLDAEHWNAIKPEQRIDPDPGGELKRMHASLERSLKYEASLGNVPEASA